ncbi:putative minor tail protein [uncultured Caudovirales phage]|uniref:Putative minor tail protein n=1 Tax=uncultured Caudovirales phage TaxID=2100421 RepID=A0A2H4J3U6_9CAUD|nr:putative minor tail protein [uncultured Caudovirales phage]
MYQYERNTKLNMKFKDAFDVRETNKAVLEFVDDHIDINIPAYKGDRGEKGDPGPSPVYQYSVPSVGDLAAIAEGLTEAEAGYWYGVDGSSSGWIWNGRDLVEREDFIGQKGDRGDMPNLVGGVFSSGPTPGGSIEEVSPGNYRINVVSQKGDKGEKGDRGLTGPAASIASAADFSAALGVAAGDVVVRKADGTYTTTPQRVPAAYFLPSSEFRNLVVPKGSAARKNLLARIALPGQPFAYRPSVIGRVIAEVKAGTQIEVYTLFTTPITGTVTIPPEGTICAYALTGSAGGTQSLDLLPYFQDTSGPVAPESPFASIPANTPMEYFVVIDAPFAATDDGFSVSTMGASLQITCHPV